MFMSHLFIHISTEISISVYTVHACYTPYILLAKYKITWCNFSKILLLLLLLFSSLTLITHLPFSPHLPAAQAADLLHLLKVKSDQPLTPCWDIWTFCCCTYHLPKLAWITVSHEQLNCACGRQCTLGGKRQTKMTPCGGRQVLPGWTGRVFEEAHAGMRAVAEGYSGKRNRKKRKYDI